MISIGKPVLWLAFLLVSTHASAIELYLYGEKPGLARPSAPPTDAAPVELHLARGEYETFIVRLAEEKNGWAPLQDLKLELKETPAVRFEVYQLGSHRFAQASAKSGPSGEIPDIAVPIHLARQPGFRIPKDNVPSHPSYLFEVQAEKNAKPGTYSGTLRFKAGETAVSIPVRIRIYQAALADRFRMKATFGFAPWATLKKHFGKWVPEEHALYQKYFEQATRHRIDFHQYYVKMAEPRPKELAKAPKKEFDPLNFSSSSAPTFMKQWKEVRDSWASTDLPVPDQQKDNPDPQFWKDLNASVVKNGLKDDSFVFFIDEPKDKDLPRIAANLRKIRQWAPDITFLGTLHYRKELEGTFNAWCPNLYEWEIDSKPGPSFYLDRRKAKGEKLWLYTGCNSHGCTGPDPLRLADLVTDRPSAFQRVFPWIGLRYQADGILYYTTVEGYGVSPESPWKDAFLFTGYGEGNLFYPCTPAVCGTQGHEPIPSLRLKIVRDGLEDAEILAMARAKGLPVDAWVKELIPSVRDFPITTLPYETLKRRALEALEKP